MKVSAPSSKFYDHVVIDRNHSGVQGRLRWYLKFKFWGIEVWLKFVEHSPCVLFIVYLCIPLFLIHPSVSSLYLSGNFVSLPITFVSLFFVLYHLCISVAVVGFSLYHICVCFTPLCFKFVSRFQFSLFHLYISVFPFCITFIFWRMGSISISSLYLGFFRFLSFFLCLYHLCIAVLFHVSSLYLWDFFLCISDLGLNHFHVIWWIEIQGY